MTRRVRDICNVTAMQRLQLDRHQHGLPPLIWPRQCIRDHYDEYDGFVITHGTDTMATPWPPWSYMVQGSRKPIVFTAPEVHLFRDTDARGNLRKRLLLCRQRRRQRRASGL
jgi:L-asparaginase/Glu-tRNA(Gln) amidotransferase subunit D